MIHKRSTALVRSVKYFTGGLKTVVRHKPHPQFRCGSRHIDVWFARKTFSLPTHHLQKHINQDIKGDKAKIRTQQYIKLNTGAKEIQQVIPVGLTTAKA